jgi:hypothetical protein
MFATATRIAASQHGRVTRQQLLDAGIDASRIGRWLADGRLVRVHKGVYAIGHPAPSELGTYHGAVLACGSGAVLSHAAMAHLLQVIRYARVPRPEVTVPTANHRARPGIIVHRVRALHILDTSIFEGIPITTVPRGLLDLAPRLTDAALTRACHEAWVRHETSPEMVIACLDRNPHKPGARRLRRALGSDVTLSDLEDAFVALLRRHRLPAARTNVDRAGDKVDCHWPQIDLTVELLSYRYHASRQGFEADVARRRRSNHVAFTFGDIVTRGSATVAELASIAGWSACGR